MGSVDQHLSVKPACSEQRRVEDLGPVGRRQQHQARGSVKAVQLDEQLIERLLLLVVTAYTSHAAGTTKRVKFIDKDDCRSLAPGLFEQVAHPGCAHSDE